MIWLRTWPSLIHYLQAQPSDICSRLLYLVVMVTCCLSELHAPCYKCYELHHMQNDQPPKVPAKTTQIKSARQAQADPCPKECSCQREYPDCKDQVDVIKDGCCGCLVCARQQGEDCDRRFRCDSRRGFYCHYEEPGSHVGICRAKHGRPCIVEGKTYEDGELFKPECRRLCSCQNGNYACSSLCPHEDYPPSPVFCEVPVLVEIPGQCCREWVCMQERHHPAFQIETTTAVTPAQEKVCKKETTKWGSCSVTCGMGVAYRVTNDNKDCIPIQQTRLCFIRPCTMQDKHLRGHLCKSTWKSGEDVNLKYEKCVSVKQYKPKYCSTCKRNRCCTPEITKTITVEFKCKGNKETIMNFMWIKSCACHKHCEFNK